MGSRSPRPVVLDAGALIALDRGDERVRELLRAARPHPGLVTIPAAVLAQVWTAPARHALLNQATRHRSVVISALDEVSAKASGILCRATGTSDIVDASVVIAARSRGAVVVTSDPGDLRALDPALTLFPV
jgi:predicted nucleic acid-binding protein